MRTDEKWYYTKFSVLLNHCKEILDLLCAQSIDPVEKAVVAKRVEDEADSVMAEIVERLRSVRRLPFERGTVFNLAHNIDNVIDELEKAADRMKSYKVQLDEAGQNMLALLAEAIKEAKKAVSCLGKKQFSQLEGHCLRIKILESEADKIHRDAIETITRQKDALINQINFFGKRAIAVCFEIQRTMRQIEDLNRLQEIIEILESAFDQAQDVADLMEELRYELE